MISLLGICNSFQWNRYTWLKCFEVFSINFHVGKKRPGQINVIKQCFMFMLLVDKEILKCPIMFISPQNRLYLECGDLGFNNLYPLFIRMLHTELVLNWTCQYDFLSYHSCMITINKRGCHAWCFVIQTE